MTEKDIKGTTSFSNATGRILEGTEIILRQIQIGNVILRNVDATVVHTQDAPLLLGQSALGRFAKITIDNEKGELTLE